MATKVNLTKYGFERTPEEDFSDDGTRFYCYKVGRVRVSKATWQGEYFIDGRLEGNLDYNVYSKLPHYRALGRLNGTYTVSDQDVIDLYNACVEFEKEYEAEESKLVYPTAEELRDKHLYFKSIRAKELDEIKELIKANIDKLFKFDSYDYKKIYEYYKNLERAATVNPDLDKWISEMLNTGYSINYVKDVNEERQNYWYLEIKKLLK